MKIKHKLLATLLAASILTASAQAGMWSTVTSMNLKEKKPTATYTLDTAGFNPRIYEWVSADRKMKCVALFSSSSKSSSPALQCTPINKENN